MAQQPVLSPAPINPPAATPGLRTLGTGATEAAAGNDSRFGATLANSAQSVGALRALAAAPPNWSVWQTNGYASAGDGGAAVYDWSPADTATDDGALTIKITTVATGRFKFRKPVDKIFPLACCSIDSTGATHVGAALTTLAATLYAAGYYGMRGALGLKFNLTASSYNIMPRVEGYPWRHYDVEFVGDSPSTAFTTGIGANITVESGATGAGATDPLAAVPYGPRTFTQTLYAGAQQFLGVTDIRNLTVGDPILVRIGADPTDASGVAHSYFITHITVITPTTGNAGNITVDGRVLETPPFPLPAYNINGLRFGNQHDLFKITAFQDNILYDNCRQRDSGLGGQWTRNMVINRPYSEHNVAFATFFGCFGVKITQPIARVIKGINTDAGNPASDPFANYGWWLVLDTCRDTTVSDLQLDSHDAAVGVLDQEAQCRNTKFTGTTRIIFNTPAIPAALPINTGFGNTPFSSGLVEVDTLVIDGGGEANSAGNLRVKNLRLGVSRAYTAGVFPGLQFQPMNISGSQISDSVVFRGSLYSQKRRCTVFCNRLTASATKTFPIPIHGLVRQCRVYSSAVTGVTSFRVSGPVSSDPGNDDHTSLISGGWAELVNPTILNQSIQNYVSDTQTVEIITNGSFVATTYFVVELEIWVNDGAQDGTTTVTDTSPRQVYAVSGAPTADADFLGQYVQGDSGTAWYKAVNIGTGASDWIKIAGSPLPATFAVSAIPGTPGAGMASVGVDTVSKNLFVKDDAGVVKHGVQTTAPVTHEFATGIDADGVVSLAAPASADISDSTASGRAMLTAATAAAQAALLGGVILVPGTNLTDANATIAVGGGTDYRLPASTLTTARTLTLGDTGAAGKRAIQVRVESQGSNYVIQDSAATTLLTVSSGTRIVAAFVWDATTTLFQLASWAPFT